MRPSHAHPEARVALRDFRTAEQNLKTAKLAHRGSRYPDVTANEIDPPKEFDNYEIMRELGRGATGSVYLARDAMLDREVAIKFVADLDAAARQRFLFEARAVAKIHHQNVVLIYDIGTHAGRPYFVAEKVGGESLAKLAKPVPWQNALDIAIGLARGLAAAHRCEVVHCDLKPSNVMIDPGGAVKIIDFGLARTGASAKRIPVGTPDYMAPEVWRGEAPSCRADVYSFGAVLFELLAGAPPFGDVEPAVLRQRVIASEAPALRDRAPEVDAALADVVARCLRREPECRFADGDELVDALERLHASRRYTPLAGENPYRGLQSFEASHRGVFYGRRSEVDDVVARLRSDPIVLVTGASGVGKSSLCRAGVVPAVLEGELGGSWQALAIVPGRRPAAALASAIGDSTLVPRICETPALLPRELRRHAGDRGLIVFIDQLEELMTLGDPGEVAAIDAGLAALADGVPGLRLLATVRADFLARISTLPGLGRDLSRLLYFLRPLPPERLRDVIVGPAAVHGVRFESDDIVNDLVAATAEATAEAGGGGLPLLSFALADLWEARDRAQAVIPRAAVTAMGGVTGALSRHANVVVGGMIAADLSHARNILLQLVTAMGTRAQRTASELVLDESARKVLDTLVTGRLVVVRNGAPEPVYELAHECLLAGWDKLKQWLDADSADRAARERLTAAAAEWVRLGRRGDATWQGRRLDEATALDPATLTPENRAFVAASRRVARRQRWQRGLVGFGAVVLVVLAFAIQRYITQRELGAAIADDLRHARAFLGAAQKAARARSELAARAFAAFDEGRWDDAEPLWERAMRTRAEADLAYRNASKYLEQAFAKDPARVDVRDLIGDVLFDRARLAEEAHERDQKDEYFERLGVYDADGSRRARWSAPGHLDVRAPPGATITLEPALEPARVIGTGTAATQLRPGQYVVVIATPGRVLVRAPILVERGRGLAIDVDPPHVEDVPNKFVYVPRGEFLYGNANEQDRLTFFSTTPLRRRLTGAFLIGRTEVTVGDWLEYVEALPPAERARMLPAVPSKVSGAIAIKPDGQGRWRIELQPAARRYTAGWDEPIVYTGRKHQDVQKWQLFPILGVSARDATAYAEWLDSTGRVRGARLCSEVEWERAARGVDGRAYPGGRPLEGNDANIDVTHGYAMIGPNEVGSHPASRSPFGLDDTSGNALEWTISERGGFILRSGSYWHDRKSAHLTNRSYIEPTVHDATIGFRLCATPPLPR